MAILQILKPSSAYNNSTAATLNPNCPNCLTVCQWPWLRILLSAAVTSCGSQWQLALALLDEADRLPGGCDVILVSSAITACDKASQWQPAVLMLKELKNRKKLAP